MNAISEPFKTTSTSEMSNNDVCELTIMEPVILISDDHDRAYHIEQDDETDDLSQ